MFTGIVEEVGRITGIRKGAKSSVLQIEGKVIFEDLKIGDSVAVNGVCLTVTSISGNCFLADVMSETLQRSSLGVLKQNSVVNLERAMAANGRFGGHIVSGHIDGTGTIVQMKPEGNATWVQIRTPDSILKYIVQKGSVAIDGISLTVAKVTKDSFFVSLIPHTGQETTLLTKKAGEIVNLENDIVGKYVDRLLHFDTVPADQGTTSSITLDFLTQHGF